MHASSLHGTCGKYQPNSNFEKFHQVFNFVLDLTLSLINLSHHELASHTHSTSSIVQWDIHANQLVYWCHTQPHLHKVAHDLMLQASSQTNSYQPKFRSYHKASSQLRCLHTTSSHLRQQITHNIKSHMTSRRTWHFVAYDISLVHDECDTCKIGYFPRSALDPLW